MKLTAKLMLVFLVAVMSLTAVYGVLAIRHDAVHFEQQQHQQVAQVGTSLKETLVVALRDDGREGAIQIIKETMWQSQADAVRWVWLDPGPDELDRPAIPTDRLSGVADQRPISFSRRDATGNRHLHTYFPIRTTGNRLGALEFTRPLEPLENEKNTTIVSTLALVGAMAFSCVLLVVVLGVKMIGKPLNKLIEKTRRTGEGDFSQPLELPQHDELGQLATALNQMCDQLAQQQNRIQTEATARIAALQQLRHADRLKTVGRLAAGIAHELGTPLNVVSGRAGLIASGKLSADEITESASAIKTEADRITLIVRQFLDFARRNTPQRSPVDLRVLVKQTMDLLQTLADKHHVRMQFLPQGDTFLASADAGQLQQVLTNVIVNAIQSMPDGGDVILRLGCGHVTPPESELSEGDYFSIAVHDQGPGISDEDMEHIFEPFYTTKDVGQGTGLGLSIAYGIVREHGGWIEVVSEPQAGSCFTVYFPEESPSCLETS